MHLDYTDFLTTPTATAADKRGTFNEPILDYQVIQEDASALSRQASRSAGKASSNREPPFDSPSSADGGGGGGGTLYKVTFQVKTPMTGPIYMYYALDNYHQNYRKYVSSVNRRQLAGEALTAKQLAKTCFPIISPSKSLQNYSQFEYSFPPRF